ncbi:SEL1-like repeat protein [Elioraea thermophila]|uniref:hypothetical protein n=1 Tax=Elioraea thermophila TaxID=2185104 RepID=UPI000DF2978E|nr:hypothetical protein [Elioraea thermophila]
MAAPSVPTARVEPDPNRPLGHARISLEGLGQPLTDGRFSIIRPQMPAAHLGPSGWQIGEAVLTALAVESAPSAGALILGPDVCRHLEPGPLTLRLPSLGLELPLFWPASIAVFDEGEVGIGLGRAVAAREPSPAPASPPPPAPPPRPAPTAKPPARTVRRLPLILAFAVTVAAAAAAAFWWLAREGPSRPSPLQAQPPVAAPVWPDGTDGLTVAEVVARAPDTRGIFAVALRRQAAGRHDDALVLFEVAAEAGLAEAHTALGRLYDPNGFVPGRPFRSPDVRQAARHYREAERGGDPEAAARRATLRAHLEREAAAGSGTARDALREFWP